MKSIVEKLKTKIFPNGKHEPFSYSQTESNLHSPHHFRQRMLIEKRRAERLSSISSLAIINPRKLPEKKNGYLENFLTKNICGLVRETDVVSFYKKKILILLPDTDKAAARKVYQRLIEKLNSDKDKLSEMPRCGFWQHGNGNYLLP